MGVFKSALVLLALSSLAEATIFAEGMAPWILTSAKSDAHSLSWQAIGFGDRGGYRASGCAGTSCSVFSKTGIDLLNPNSFECLSFQPADLSCLEWGSSGDCGMAGIGEWICSDYSQGPCLKWRATCAAAIATPSSWLCSAWNDKLCVKWTAALSNGAGCPESYSCNAWNGAYCSNWVSAIDASHFCFVNSWSCTGCQDYCANVNCNDRCEGGKLFAAGSCSFGSCNFASTTNCRLGCENAACKPNHAPKISEFGGGFNQTGETVAFVWQGYDEDGDAIGFELFFGGKLALNSSETHFEMNASELGDGDYSFALVPFDVEEHGNASEASVSIARLVPSPAPSIQPAPSIESMEPEAGVAENELQTQIGLAAISSPTPTLSTTVKPSQPSSSPAPSKRPTPSPSRPAASALQAKNNDEAAAKPNAPLNEEKQGKQERLKTDWTGALYAAGGLGAAGIGLAARKKEFEVRRRKNKTLVTVRSLHEPKTGLKLMQVLGEGSNFNAAGCEKTELINGTLLTWEKPELGKGGEWTVEYESDCTPLQTILVFKRREAEEKKFL